MIPREAGGRALRERATGLSHPQIALDLTGTLPRSALRTKPADNDFAIPKNPFAERTRRRLGHAVPLHVLNLAAAVADEVVMSHALHVESRCAALDCHFADQPRLHQVPQVVIGRAPGRARIDAIHSFEDLRSRGMTRMFRQKRHDGVALRSTPQARALQGPSDLLGVHEKIRIILI